MVLYNVTIKVDWSIHLAFMNWMREDHVPKVLATGCFVSCRVWRVLEADDTDGPTYAFQYEAKDAELYNRYQTEFSPLLREEVVSAWGENYLAFRSVLKEVRLEDF